MPKTGAVPSAAPPSAPIMSRGSYSGVRGSRASRAIGPRTACTRALSPKRAGKVSRSARCRPRAACQPQGDAQAGFAGYVCASSPARARPTSRAGCAQGRHAARDARPIHVRPGNDRVPKPKSPSPLPPPINCWSSQVAPIMRACRAMGRWDFSSTSTPPPRSCASYGRLPPSALPFEGITGSRDSGGPLLIGDGSLRRLVDLAPWSQYPPGRPFVEGLYGEIVYAVRVSQYVGWIEKVISAP